MGKRAGGSIDCFCITVGRWKPKVLVKLPSLLMLNRDRLRQEEEDAKRYGQNEGGRDWRVGKRCHRRRRGRENKVMISP